MNRTICRNKLLTAGVILGVLLGGLSAAYAGMVRSDRVPPRASRIWTVWVPSGEGGLAVLGDGSTDLDCYVYDRFRTLLGKDEADTDRCLVAFYQASAGDITVQIRNRGAVYNDYLISVQ